MLASAGCPVPTRAGGCCERGRGPWRLWFGGWATCPPPPTPPPLLPSTPRSPSPVVQRLPPVFTDFTGVEHCEPTPNPDHPNHHLPSTRTQGSEPTLTSPHPTPPRSILTTPTLMPSSLPASASFVQPWKGPHPLQGRGHAPCPLTLSVWLWSWHPSQSPCHTSCSSSGADGGPKVLPADLELGQGLHT